MRGGIVVLARASGAIVAETGISEAPIFDAIVSGNADASGGLFGSINVVSGASGQINGSALIGGDCDQIIHAGGESIFFSGATLGAAAELSGVALLLNVGGTASAAAAILTGAIDVVNAAYAKADATGGLSATANTTELAGGALVGAGSLTGDINLAGHLQLIAGALGGAASTSAAPSIKERLAAAANASASIRASIRIQVATSAELDGAGGTSSYANTIGSTAGQLDGISDIFGDANPVTNPVGTTWFVGAQTDAAGSADLSVAVNADAGSVTSQAAANIQGAIRLAEWGIARASGEGSVSGSIFRVTFGGFGTDAAAALFAAAQITAPVSGRTDGTATISSNALRVRFAAGEVDAAATIRGRLAPLSFASGHTDAAASFQSRARLRVAISGEVDAVGSYSTGTFRINVRPVSVVYGTATISGSLAVVYQQAGSFSRDFSADFQGGGGFVGGTLVSGAIGGAGGLQGNLTLERAARDFSSDFSADFH